jgi:UDP-GlcNAc:undecaprenyl-phosphate GlcNAc-1-phosphate transferase
MPEWFTRFLNEIGIAAPERAGWLTVILTFLLAGVATWLFIPRVRAFAIKCGWADEPNSRRLNETPVPNVGGLAVYAGVIAALVVASLLRPIVIDEVKAKVLSILLGGSVLVITGFIDDQFGLPPFFRLVVQILAALLLVANGIRIEIAFGGAAGPVLSVLFTVFWVVAITNAINLLDGVDGLAGGVGFIIAISLLAVSAHFGERAAATLLLAALAGSTLGFLRHNFHPSRIILGDSGAYFVGYVLAASSILGNLRVSTIFGLVPPLLFLLLPLLDTFQVVVRRILRRMNPLTSPGRDHVHHQLLRRGFSQRRTTMVLWGVTLTINLVAMRVQGMSATVLVTTALGIIALLGLVVWQRGRALRVTEEIAPADRSSRGRST